MAVWRIRSSARSLGVVAIVVTLPLGLTSCSLASAGTEIPLGNELSAASGADIFEVPDEQEYEVTSIEVTDTSVASSKLQALADQSSDGSLVLSDGVITDATLKLAVVGQPNIEFALTEPVVLRRDGNGDVVNATGTLTVDNTVRYTARAAITPRFDSDEETIELDVRLDLPGAPFTLHSEDVSETNDVPSSIEATVSLAAK